MSQLLTADDVAELLQVSNKWVYAAARRGELPGVVRAGRSVRFRPDEIEEWIATGGAVTEEVAG